MKIRKIYSVFFFGIVCFFILGSQNKKAPNNVMNILPKSDLNSVDHSEFKNQRPVINLSGNWRFQLDREIAEYSMGDDVQLWNEFHPKLYNLSIGLKVNHKKENYSDVVEQSFGMVDFNTRGTQFVVNGKVAFLRGKHDACVFPITGYPPMNKEEWVRIFRIAKDYGINHYRFHCYTQPQAAFDAADIVGIYMQPELPLAKTLDKKNMVRFDFEKKEGELIIDNYANHPSFVMFSLGNELRGDVIAMAEMVAYLRDYDCGRRFFAQGSNFKIFEHRMKTQKMYSYWNELFMASGIYSAICYKEDNEMSLRTPGFGGFQILDLQDYPGQGTALVGMLDAFMDSKGLITPDAWRQSCDAQTIQAKMAKMVWENNEPFSVELIAINYGENEITKGVIDWQWWGIMKKSHPIIFDATYAGFRPIVQTIDNFERCSKFGIMFEFSVGTG